MPRSREGGTVKEWGEKSQGRAARIFQMGAVPEPDGEGVLVALRGSSITTTLTTIQHTACAANETACWFGCGWGVDFRIGRRYIAGATGAA